ncbi:homeobox-DDT domain protein RLT1-like isoform X2 [Hibiscus syriacus]|uniref:homeobox-DDT domain protein RLT1-like isoform X2 n=1 Tax=Hibiscus syriacus TaxID=106335 RepID=UPI0019216E0C|nr:homeobox-DDT domain protein RLT1-like isoform X2 [Hibiscus syriacus]
MEPGSEGENDQVKNPNKTGNSSNEGNAKPKRQMKTPFQLETLETAYALETYPSEATRAELSEKLGLTDRQLQMWFCHRRLKEKKDTPTKKPRKGAALPPGSPMDESRGGPDPENEFGSGYGSSPCMERKLAGGYSRGMVDDVPPTMRRYYESQQSIMELRSIACVEAQLGEPLRDDGPILGLEFDPLPPDAFGAIPEPQKRSVQPYENKVYELHDSRSNKAASRAFHDYQFLPEHSSLRSDAYGQVTQSLFHESPVDGARGRVASFAHGEEPLSRVHGIQGHGTRVHVLPQQDKTAIIPSPSQVVEDSLAEREPFTNGRITAQSSSHLVLGHEDSYMLSAGQTLNNDADLRNDRKRKSDEIRIAREAEAHENRIRKELEKLDNKRRKSEERIRKEMERHERERRKEEERLLREKQREEERMQREQRREMERREKFLQKEYLRAEKKRQKEELRREKEEERRRVAREKAAARKIAKESMDLLDDEQLELMEFAAASKGISSTIHLDHESLQNLESFRSSLSLFPPKSVQLKRIFSIQPWVDSEENVGNLFMAWRFLITFADVLSLWPFTLDEFIQGFHDYDSRLLGEIHVALLKAIIKDIEDVARTPVTGSGMNQYSAANPEGGHPQIVEGAYSWGFDIRNWQHHLNPLTWPEIFRQLAISAGFGPKLKKLTAGRTYMGDNDEGTGCENVVSTLRNGSAAENAFALMREKGLLHPRRSRHRLTPGTVKFAAFHVLSLEGGEGLTVLELADKIQKSGLRDLSTSRTPEASISVALTRDTKLFERIAPSTYCVRPAYRRDPADAEAILAEARKKIRQFENGILGEDTDEVERDDMEKDDVERDEDSECDLDEDPEVDDIATPSNANKDTDYPKDGVNTYSGSEKVRTSTNAAPGATDEFDEDFPSFPSNTMKDANDPSSSGQYVASDENGTGNPDQQNLEINESESGESWIQGLSEGEYSHLSVEERLNALVTLIGIANEGNSIRAVLEDRLEAANALKKQMWTEAQLDKSHLKEEIIIQMDFQSVMETKAEAQLPTSALEVSPSPFPTADNKNDEASLSITEDKKPLLCSQNVQNDLNIYPAERALVFHEASVGPDNFFAQQHGYASKRSRSQLKSYIAHRAEEMYVYRSLPLGQDRKRNRYWQFVACASKNDPCSGRIFVELHDGRWRLIDTEEAFDALLASLDTRGIRESHLRIMLHKIESSFKENAHRSLQGTRAIGRSGSSTENEASEVDSSPDFPASSDGPSSVICRLNSDASETLSSFKIQLGRNENEKKSALKRYLDFQNWMWKECYNSSTLFAMKYGKKRCEELLTVCDACLGSHIPEEMHCGYCHQNVGSINNCFDFSEHEIQCKENRNLDTKVTLDSSHPSGINLIKFFCALVEVCVPPEALESIWTEGHRKIWGSKLNASSSVGELLKMVSHFESAVKRDYLSSNFETMKELLGSTLQSESDATDSVLPWIPQTTAAVALRLLELDVSIMYVKPVKVEPSENKEARAYIKLPSRTPFVIKNKQLEELNHEVSVKGEKFPDVANSRSNNYKRGRGSREQGSGRQWQRRGSGSKYDSGKRSARQKNNLTLHLKQQGQRTNGQSSGHGRRTVRKRSGRRDADNMTAACMANVVKSNTSAVSVRDMDEEWRFSLRTMPMANPPDSNSAEESDDNVQDEGYEQGNWELDYNNGASNGWNREPEVANNGWDRELAVASDKYVVDYDGGNGFEQLIEEDDEDSDGDLGMSDASDERVADRTRNDEGSDSAVSDDSSD